MNTSIINLDQIENLQKQIELLWTKGIRTFKLKGNFKAQKDTYALLEINKHLSGISLIGSSATLNGKRITSHIIIIKDANVTIEGITIIGGDTTNPSRIANNYSGWSFRSIYEAIDGSGLLVLGNSNVKLKNCVIADNHSGMCGGGISNQATGLVEIDQCKFKNNTAYHTGAAVDNLTKDSKIVINKSKFRDNLSNVGSLCGGPHGQITIFANTNAKIQHNKFFGKTFPIDTANDSKVQNNDNIYRTKFTAPVVPINSGTFKNKFEHLKHLFSFEILLIKYGIYPWVHH